jgi:hypothetical protein
LINVPPAEYELTVTYGPCAETLVVNDLLHGWDDVAFDDDPSTPLVVDIWDNTPSITGGNIYHFEQDVSIGNVAAHTWNVHGSQGNDVVIRMANNKGIIVESQNSVGHNLDAEFAIFESACASYWNGIEIQGAASDFYSDNALMNAELLCGEVGSVKPTSIRYATCAIRCQTTNETFYGGKYRLYDMVFDNNLQDIRQVWPIGLVAPVPTSNQIQRTRSVLDNNYFSPDFPLERIFLQSTTKTFMRRLTLENLHSDFLTDEGSNHMVGIFTNNAKYQLVQQIIDQNSFRNVISGFSRGIVRYGGTGDSNPNSITGTDFYNFRDIYFEAVPFVKMEENTFNPLPWAVEANIGTYTDNASDLNVTYGVYFNNCQGYTGTLFEENEVGKYLGEGFVSMGLIANNCGPVNNRVRENYFHGGIDELEKMDFAIVARNRNRNSTGTEPFSLGLHMTCNTFANNEEDIVVVADDDLQELFDTSDPDLDLYGVRRWQGSSSNPPKNDFLGSVGISDMRNELSYDNGVTIVIPHNYYVLSTNPQENIGEFINVNQTTTNTQGTLCIEDWGFSGSNEQQLMAQSNLNSLKVEYEALVDGGNTEMLTNEVINTTYTEALATYYELISHSPNLSEKVMLEALDKFELPNVLLTEILASNPTAAKSNEVQRGVANRIIPFDEYQQELINEGLTWVSYKEQIESELSLWQEVYDAALLQEVNEQLESENIVNALNLLADEWNANMVYKRAELIIENENYTSAIALLESWVQNNILSPYEDVERLQMISYYQLMNEVIQSDWNELYFEELKLLSETANFRAKFAALGQLGLLGEITPPEPLIVPFTNENRRLNSQKSLYIHDFDIFPNPATYFSTLHSASGLDGQVLVNVMNNIGQVIDTFNWNPSSEYLNIPLEAYANGLYSVSIRREGTVIFTSKLVVLR